MMMTEIERLIKDSIEAAKTAVERARQEEAERRLNILNDNWTEILEAAVDSQFHPKTAKNIRKLPDTSQNIFKRVTHLISQVYTNGTTRKAILNDAGDTDERYDEIMADFPLDVIMADVNRYTNGLNETFALPVWRSGRIEYDIITPDMVSIQQRDNDPTRMASLTYRISLTNTKGETETRWVYWDIYGNHRIFDDKGADITSREMEGNPDGVNPYKNPEIPGETIIPAVCFHRTLPIFDFWGWTNGADLVDGTIECGVLLTYLNEVLKTNSFKQLILSGVNIKDLPADLVFDTRFPLMFQGGGTASVLDYATDPRPIADVIKDKINALINAYGISGDLYRATNSASSGYALKLSREELIARREEQVKVYKMYERELFEVTRVVNNYHAPKKISDKAEFSIDFNEMLFDSSPDEIQKQWTFDISIGARSAVDYIRYLNPDMTEEEAMQKLESNKRLNEKAKGKGVDIDSILKRVQSGPELQAR